MGLEIAPIILGTQGNLLLIIIDFQVSFYPSLTNQTRRLCARGKGEAALRGIHATAQGR